MQPVREPRLEARKAKLESERARLVLPRRRMPNVRPRTQRRRSVNAVIGSAIIGFPREGAKTRRGLRCLSRPSRLRVRSLSLPEHIAIVPVPIALKAFVWIVASLLRQELHELRIAAFDLI